MNYAIIVAGGTGNRMGSHTPKQFLLLNNLPVMMHTINAFYHSKSCPRIVVALHPGMQDFWSSLCENYNFQVKHTISNAGESRFESVRNSLQAIRSMDADAAQRLIAIHDAVRPLINPDLIDRLYEQALLTGAAAPALQSTNSVRLKSENGLQNTAYPREKVYLMQTPQTFKGSLLFEAYNEQHGGENLTDDAPVVEKKGYPITLVDGDTRNIKITFPDDLRIAASLLEGQHSSGASDNAQ